jgi:cell division septation protein DedD
VFVGQALLLPSLTPGTLLRGQPDGSYRIIATTSYRLPRAGEYAARLRNEGYQVTITPKKVTDNLSLYRVEIGGLKGFEEAHHTWLATARDAMKTPYSPTRSVKP